MQHLPQALIDQLVLPAGEFAGAIFDCDGTLADTMPAHYAAWLEVLAPHGLDREFDEPLFYSFGGVPTREIVRFLNTRHGTALDAEAVFHAKEEAFLRHSREVAPVGPVVAAARALAGRIPIAVASGGPRSVVHPTLERIGLLCLFDAVITQDDVERGKPFPDIFLLAARRLEVDPARCIVFEDAEAGRQAALAAGMTCVLVDPRKLTAG